MASDMIENYEGHPAFQFFRDFDADCDWSEAVAGEIGEYIAVVRRAGENYFLGAGTNGEKREVEIPLDFLKEGVSYTATVYADDDQSNDPEAYKISTLTVTSADKITVRMNANGGQAITFMPAK